MQKRQTPAVEGLTCTVGPSRHPEAGLHSHPQLEVGWCHAGAGTVLVEGRLESFRAPCAAVVAPGDRHFHHSAPGATSRWTFLILDSDRLLPPGTPAAVVAAGRTAAASAVLTPDRHATACRLVQVLAETWDREGAVDPVVAGGVLQALLAVLARLPAARRLTAGNRDLRLRLEPALRLLATRRGEGVRVADLAAACGLGGSAFRDAFGRAFGDPPKRFLDRYRLNQAAAALVAHPERRILALALEAGFGSQSAFNRAFRAEFGVAPRAWRRGEGREVADGSPPT
jgi:AraC-like DNA-binding protein